MHEIDSLGSGTGKSENCDCRHLFNLMICFGTPAILIMYIIFHARDCEQVQLIIVGRTISINIHAITHLLGKHKLDNEESTS